MSTTPVTPPVVHAYTFTLVSTDILNLRSPHSDTDYVSFTLRINPQTIDGKPATGPANTLFKKLGNLGTGTHSIDLSFPKVGIDSTDTVVLNYLILNSSTDPTKVQTAMTSSGDRLSSAIGAVKSLADLTGLGTLINTVREQVSLILDTFHALFGTNANCDGTVAAEQAVVLFQDLVANTANGKVWATTTTHPGTDSPKGCGKNSVYEVTWTVTQNGPLIPVRH
jgi:hypothetical protein